MISDVIPQQDQPTPPPKRKRAGWIVLTDAERTARERRGDALSRMVITMTDDQRATLLCQIVGGVMGRYQSGAPEEELQAMLALASQVKCGPAKGS